MIARRDREAVETAKTNFNKRTLEHDEKNVEHDEESVVQ